MMVDSNTGQQEYFSFDDNLLNYDMRLQFTYESRDQPPEENNVNSSDIIENITSDPFNPKCRIPLPDVFGNFSLLDSSTFIRRRNERERTRVRNVNDGFEKLRSHLPLMHNQREKRLSKVETLRLAIAYIKHLQRLLEQTK